MNTFEWISKNIHLLGWSTISAVASRLLWLTFRGGTLFISARGRVLAAEQHLTKMATNCVPTIQTATLNTNEILSKQTELLENMDKNIAILVDRGR